MSCNGVPKVFRGGILRTFVSSRLRTLRVPLVGYLLAYLSVGATLLLVMLFMQRKYIRETEVSEVLTLSLITVLGWPAVIAILTYWKVGGSILDWASGAEEWKFAPGMRDLVRPLAVEEIEKLEAVVDPLGAAPALPFGHLNPAWRRFVQGVALKNKLWSYRAFRKDRWGKKERREGYAIVRYGIVGMFFETVNCRLDPGA